VRPPTVLLVDDNAPLRRSMKRILEADGFEVHASATAAEAIETSETFDGPIDALVTDLLLPGMDGFEIGRRLRERRPDLRVIIVTGDVDRAHRDVRASVVDGIVRKPFDAAALIEQVRRAIEQPPG